MSPPLRATFSPAHPPADIFHPPYPPIAAQSISQGRAIRPSEGLPISPTLPSGALPDYPSLRALDEHSFIVRVLRA